MKNVLVINSSVRRLNSHSRKLTEVFIDHWKIIQPGSMISFRELGDTGVPHISENWITAAFKPEQERSAEETEILKVSDAYISELRQADVIVIGAPMYNWSVPSTLKAYIDQVMRINETWKPDPDDRQNPYVGLLQNKTLFLLLSRGSQGYEKGECNEHMNFQSTYLKVVFNIMGISNIHLITVERGSLDTEDFKKAIVISHQKVKSLIEIAALPQ